jgi:hypothetical protein
VIIHNIDDQQIPPPIIFFNGHDQSELSPQSQGSLVLSLARQFLKPQTCKSIQISLVVSGGNDRYDLEESVSAVLESWDDREPSHKYRRLSFE